MEINRHQIGSDLNQSILTIDNFYHDPEKIYSFAAQSKFNSNFPGVKTGKTDKYASVLDLPDDKELQHLMKRLTGYSTNSFVNRFQLNLANVAQYSNIHWDGIDWIGLVYLGKSHDGEPGTNFYKHKRSGLHLCTPDTLKEASDKMDVSAVFLRDMLLFSARDDKEWDLIKTIEFRFNRFVCFPANVFHANASFWGTSAKDGRLVQAMFFK